MKIDFDQEKYTSGFLIIQGVAWVIAFMHITGINIWKPPNYWEPDFTLEGLKFA